MSLPSGGEVVKRLLNKNFEHDRLMFENWMYSIGQRNFTRNKDGYEVMSVNNAWSGWRERTKSYTSTARVRAGVQILKRLMMAQPYTESDLEQAVKDILA